MTAPALELLVVQPTPFCNLDCDYCYLPARSSRARMTEAVLRRTFNQVLESGWVDERFTVVWHAGEPLVMPVAFYEEAFDFLDGLNAGRYDVSHSFQTNATLVDDAWCDLIKTRDVRIGVSVDGPADIHDAHRVTRDGRGTHRRVMDGIARLQDAGIEFHTISVLTTAALDRAEEMFAFFRDHGLRRVGFNVEEIEGANTASTLEVSDARDRVRRFFAEMIALNEAAGRPLAIRETDPLAAFILRGEGGFEGNQENQPLAIVSVDHTGNVSTWSPELLDMTHDRYGEFVLGNVMTSTLDEMIGTPHYRKIAGDIAAGVENCRRNCQYFAVCGGGSPANKLFECGDLAATETLHCRLSRMAVVDAVLEHLEGVL